MCTCIEDSSDELAKKNIMLIVPFRLSARIMKADRVLIQIKKRDKRIKKPLPNLFASFCPFCGKQYQDS